MFFLYLIVFFVIGYVLTCFFMNPGGFIRTIYRRTVLLVALLFVILAFGVLPNAGFQIAWTIVAVALSVPFLWWYKTLRSLHLG